MKRENIGNVSAETIYKFIYSKEGKFQKLSEYLARTKKTRTKLLGRKRNKTKIPNRIDILTRPEIINERSTIGHFEGDSIVGVGKGAALHTEVDRYSRYTQIRKIAQKTADLTAKAMTDIFSTLPKEKVLSTTLDNGTEFCKWEKVVENIGLDIYFARPYRSSERGTKERMNGFVRKFFPKKTDFDLISDHQIQVVQDWINHRPMKVLDFRTPHEVFVALDNRL
jgi:IS30 family transposase